MERTSKECRKKADVDQPVISGRVGSPGGPMAFLKIGELLIITCVLTEVFCKCVLHWGGKNTYPFWKDLVKVIASGLLF